MRILQYMRVLDNGGIEKFVFSNLDKIDKTKFNFDYLVIRNQIEPCEHLVKRYQGKKIVLEFDYTKPKIHEYKWLFRLYKFFKSCDYKIVDFQAVGPFFNGTRILFVAWLAHVPVRIIHSHGALPINQYSLFWNVKLKISRFLNCLLATDFVACSDLAAEFAFTKTVIANGRVNYINNAIDVDRFVFNESIRVKTRQKLGVEGKHVIGHVGRFVKQKNHEFIVEIFKEYIKLDQNAVLLLVGSEVETEPGMYLKIKQLVKDYCLEDKVIFYGESVDPAPLFLAMDLFLFPSIWEGLGIVGIEAQASGLKVLAASDCIPKQLKVSNNLVWLSLRESSIVWAQKINEIGFEYKRENMKKIVTEKGYDIEKTAKQLECLYSSCIERLGKEQ